VGSLPFVQLPFAAPQARSIGRYLLFGEIAAGGMATVHFGRLTGAAGFSRTVAIKRLHPNFAKDSEFVAMFVDEARLAARIRHPNVVPTLDVVATEGEIFLVMEYVHGESLAKLHRAMLGLEQPTAPRIIATVMSGVLHGLHAAHEAKTEQGESLSIVHRDVSPQNVLVGVDGVARVLDFGVAKAMGRVEATHDRKVKGKIAYMPPEQIEGGLVTRQADIYAAAVVTWQALTGRRLFRGEHEGALVRAVLRQPLVTPSSVASHVPEAFDDVVMRGLDRDPSRRYATAREMALQLERCAGIASPSEVGDWVASLAHEELTTRASRLAEIESASWPAMADACRMLERSERADTNKIVRGRSFTPTVVEGATSGHSNAPAGSDVSHVIAAPGFSPLNRLRARISARAAVVVGCALLAATFLLTMAVRRHTATPAFSATAAVQAGIAAPAAAPGDPESLRPSLPNAASDSPPSSASPRDGSGTVPGRRELGEAKQQPSRILGPPPASPPGRPVRRECDVPFTIDDRGHKHYKAACL
jgi:serine/threonine protein kinase